jgi:hypothetical protein
MYISQSLAFYNHLRTSSLCLTKIVFIQSLFLLFLYNQRPLTLENGLGAFIRHTLESVICISVTVEDETLTPLVITHTVAEGAPVEAVSVALGSLVGVPALVPAL